MKKFSVQKFSLLILLASSALCSILTDAKHHVDERWLKLKEDVFTKLKTLAVAPNGLTIDFQQDSCPVYNPADKAKQLQICVASYNENENSISLEFRSPNNRFELEFSNIDINDAASDIQIDSYVKEYIDSLNDLVLDDSGRKAAIEEGIKAGATLLGVADAAVTADKVTYTYKNRANSIAYKITGDLLEFTTDFFQDSIDLNIPLKKFIVFEVKKLTKEIIDHLYQMQRFALSDGESAAQSIKQISCEKIFADAEMTGAVTERMTKNGLTANVAGSEMTIEKDGKSVVVSCAPITVGEFTLIEVKADFAAISPNIQPVTQTFLEKSLYNLLPVVNSFFNDLATFCIRVLADKNVEEEFEPISSEGGTG